jgi:hypothetical protein
MLLLKCERTGSRPAEVLEFSDTEDIFLNFAITKAGRK